MARLWHVLLDTSLLVAAFRSSVGASNLVLQLAFSGAYEIAASTPVFLEYEDVLQRKLHRDVHGKTCAEVDAFLLQLADILHPVELHFRWRPQLSDPDDELILETAFNGSVDAIITHNVRDFQPAAERFRIRVMTPGQFIKELRK